MHIYSSNNNNNNNNNNINNNNNNNAQNIASSTSISTLERDRNNDNVKNASTIAIDNGNNTNRNYNGKGKSDDLTNPPKAFAPPNSHQEQRAPQSLPTAAKATNSTTKDNNLTNIPPKSSWIHSPILVRCAPSVPCSIDGIKCTPTSQLRVNVVPIPFETELFKGYAMIRIANLKGSPDDYFRKRARKMQVCVQGQFKNRTR